MTESIKDTGDDQVLAAIAQLVRVGNLKRARKLCEQVLGRTPHDVDALAWLGQICMDEDRWSDAISNFDKALQLRVDPWTLGNLGNCYCKTGRLAEAEHCLRGAIALKPDLVRAHVSLAVVLHGLRQFDAALKQLEAVSQLAAHDHHIPMRKGCSLTELGRLDEAQDAFAEAGQLAARFVYPRLVAFDQSAFDSISGTGPAIPPPQVMHESTPPAECSYVVLISCDSAYARKYGFTFIRSFAMHAQGNNILHMHIYDADERIVDEAKDVAQTAGLVSLAISTETSPFPQVEKQRRKSYYACGRLVHMAYWLKRYQRPVLSLDVDIIVQGELATLVDTAGASDVGLNRREPIDSPWLDVIANIIIGNPTAAAIGYFTAVANYALEYIKREGDAWLVDQTALFCVLKMMNRYASAPSVTWISESNQPSLWHFGAANEHSVTDPRYLKYAVAGSR